MKKNNIKKITKIVTLGCVCFSLAACAPIYQIEPDNAKETETTVEEPKIVENDIQEIEKPEAKEVVEPEVDEQKPEVEEVVEPEVDEQKPEVEEVVEPEVDEQKPEVEKIEAQNQLDTVLDLKEPEDINNYKTGLVVVKQEDDYWRAIDRTGKVFRIKTNNENIKVGAVCDEATVEIDEEDANNMSVSLDSGFYSNENTKIKDGEAKAVISEIVQKEVLAYNKDGAEINYMLGEVSISKIGKAIAIAKLEYTTEDAAADEISISREIVMYGYENTWVIPGK